MGYYNWLRSLCKNKPQFCKSLKDFVGENTVFIKSQIEKYSETNDYWHQLNLVYKQLEGMQKGLDLWKEENNRIQDVNQVFSEILFLNLMPEIFDFEKFLSHETARNGGQCSALVKPLADGSDFFVAYTT
jgi:hypothetical protein